jgi:16S rRNA processing protein RimM
VILGRVAGVYGVKGWVRVHSDTAPRENILSYAPWLLRRNGDWEAWDVEEGHRHGKGVVARLAGVGDRDVAATFVGADIAVPRERLGGPGAGEYYWTDLEGLEVVTTRGVVLGIVDHLFETGANDVMVVTGDRERLVPFVEPQVVRAVDFAAGRLVVDWDPDF